jgi:hypothetical protein
VEKGAEVIFELGKIELYDWHLEGRVPRRILIDQAFGENYYKAMLRTNGHRFMGLPRAVKQTLMRNAVISTVLLGASMWARESATFETMIFWPGSVHDRLSWRYYSYAEARSHHNQVVNAVRREQAQLARTRHVYRSKRRGRW